MSRTDVHRPWLIQLADPYNRHLVYRYAMWPVGEMALTSYRNLGCGCRMCTGHHGRKLARSQERVAWRSIRAQLLAAVDRADADVPPLKGRAW